MRDQHDRAVGRDREGGEQADELLHLVAIDLAAGEDIGRRGDADRDRFDGAGEVEDLAIERCRLDLAVTADRRHDGVAPYERNQMQACPSKDPRFSSMPRTMSTCSTAA